MMTQKEILDQYDIEVLIRKIKIKIEEEYLNYGYPLPPIRKLVEDILKEYLLFKNITPQKLEEEWNKWVSQVKTKSDSNQDELTGKEYSREIEQIEKVVQEKEQEIRILNQKCRNLKDLKLVQDILNATQDPMPILHNPGFITESLTILSKAKL